MESDLSIRRSREEVVREWMDKYPWRCPRCYGLGYVDGHMGGELCSCLKGQTIKSPTTER